MSIATKAKRTFRVTCPGPMSNNLSSEPKSEGGPALALDVSTSTMEQRFDASS